MFALKARGANVRLEETECSRRKREARERQIGGDMTLLASSYPFLNILWTTLIFFAWVIFIWIAITVLIDVFRRRDISGWAKAAWVVFVVILPWIGVLAYLIFNHNGMNERSAKEARTAQSQFDEYVRQTAASGGATSEIEKAKQLLDSG